MMLIIDHCFISSLIKTLSLFDCYEKIYMDEGSIRMLNHVLMERDTLLYIFAYTVLRDAVCIVHVDER